MYIRPLSSPDIVSGLPTKTQRPATASRTDARERSTTGTAGLGDVLMRRGRGSIPARPAPPALSAVHAKGSFCASKFRDVSNPPSYVSTPPEVPGQHGAENLDVSPLFHAATANTSRTTLLEEMDDLVPASSIPLGTSPTTRHHLDALQHITRDYTSDRDTWRVAFRNECNRAVEYVQAAPRDEVRSARAYKLMFHTLSAGASHAASRIFKALEPEIARKALPILALSIAQELADYGHLDCVRQRKLPRSIEAPIRNVLSQSLRNIAKERKSAAQELQGTRLDKAARRASEGLRALAFIDADVSLAEYVDQLLDKMELSAIYDRAPWDERCLLPTPEFYFNEYDNPSISGD